MGYNRWYDRPLTRAQSAILGAFLGLLFGIIAFCAL